MVGGATTACARDHVNKPLYRARASPTLFNSTLKRQLPLDRASQALYSEENSLGSSGATSIVIISNSLISLATWDLAKLHETRNCFSAPRAFTRRSKAHCMLDLALPLRTRCRSLAAPQLASTAASAAGVTALAGVFVPGTCTTRTRQSPPATATALPSWAMSKP